MLNLANFTKVKDLNKRLKAIYINLKYILKWKWLKWRNKILLVGATQSL